MNISNPTLSAIVDEISKGNIPELIPCIRTMQRQRILNRDSDFNSSFESSMQHFTFKEQLNSLGMWCIVDLTWTKELAEYIGQRKILEVMAGTGWLAKALSHHGCNIQATDNNDWGITHPILGNSIHGIDILDATDAVNTIDADILLISWPPYECGKILDVCKAWGNKKTDHLYRRKWRM